MPVESVYPALEPLLPRVRKPIQYVGGEVGSVTKDWDSADVRWALCYPDAYEVGLPNQGVQILYEVLNERAGVLAERTYTVWPDLEALMRENGVPQFTLEAHRPVGAFDVLGVSFATEMAYTNLLTVLDLAGIPLFSAGRTDGHPLVIAGGHAAFNPEPVADFLDVVVLGDGEQAVLAITDLIRDWKQAGQPGGRDGLLLRLSKVAYVPRFYDVTYHADGRISKVVPNQRRRSVRSFEIHRDGPGCVALSASAHRPGRRDRARAVQRGDLPRLHPRLPVLPGRDDHQAGAGAVHHHDRLDGRRTASAASGFDEVGLLSLSSADHSEINEIAVDLADCYEGTNVGLSLPSTRVDAFNVTLADELSRNGRRSGLTFAPEGGSERMRKVINKMVTEEDLLRTVTTAYASGWRQVKLYFMCGLPTETDADVLAIAQLARRVIAAGREATGRRDIRCTVSIGGFVPKPHTPFQWAAQCPPEVVDARLQGAGRRAARGPRLRQGDRVPLSRRAARPHRGPAFPR